MTLVVHHAKVSGMPADPTAQVDGPAWDAAHALTGTSDASQLNSNVVQAVVNDTNIQGSIAGQTLTFSWGGTLAPGRGGFGGDISGSSGVPLFAAGVPTFTGTTGTGTFVRSISPSITGTLTAAIANFSGAVTVSNASVNAFLVTGTTINSAALNVDTSTASSVTGLNIKSAASGGGVALSAYDTGANTNISIDAKGSGTIAIGANSTGAIFLERAVGLGVSGSVVGSLAFSNLTSGSTTVQPSTGALGATILTLPAATDTLVGKATTDTLTNKTFDTAGAGNSFKINGTAITAINGSGAVVLTTNAALTTPALGTPTSGTLTNCTGLPLSGLAAQAAFTLVGNNTSGSASPTAFTITGLTLKASPAASDEALIWDVAGSAWKKATVSGIGASAGVSSIAGNTGAFTISHGIINSTNDLQLDMAVHQGMLFGLTLSTAGSSSTFGIALGAAVDVAATDFMKLTSAYTKTTSAWAVGTGNGSLDTGSIAPSTWYYPYLIKRPDTGVVDVLVSLSASAPTMPTNYTLKRRIGALRTNGSSQWVLFSQLGDEFLWSVPVADIAVSNLGSTATLFTLTVPVFQVWARLRGFTSGSGTQPIVLINSPDEATAVSNTPSGNFTSRSQVVTQSTSFGEILIRTNTSGQIRAVSDTASTTLNAVTVGWVDRRGRDN